MKNLVLKEKKISENKSYCFQIFHQKPSYFAFLKGSFKLFSDDYYFKLGACFFGDILNIATYWNRRMDHAGFNFDLTIVGLTIHFQIYDWRHWDFEENNWKNTYVTE